MKQSDFIGTAKLLRLYLRRDRIILPIWISLALMVIVGQVSFVKGMADWKIFITELSESPLTSALLGPVVPLSIEGANPLAWSAAGFHNSHDWSSIYYDSTYPYGGNMRKK